MENIFDMEIVLELVSVTENEDEHYVHVIFVAVTVPDNCIKLPNVKVKVVAVVRLIEGVKLII